MRLERRRRGSQADARTRLAACERAGVEPTFTTLVGQDPVAFILSTNFNRRHLTKSQRALIATQASLLAAGNRQREVAVLVGVSRQLITQAEAVLKWAPELSDAVLEGSLSLDAAYEEARARKGAASRPRRPTRRWRSLKGVPRGPRVLALAHP